MVTEFYYPHIGGVEVVFKELAEGFARKGHNIKVITCKVPGSARFSEINGVKIIRIRVLPFLHRYMFTFAAIFRCIKEAGWADIVQTTTYNSAFPAWVGAKTRRKKCFLMVHEVWVKKWRSVLGEGWLKAFVLSTIEKMILVLPFDKYICVSNSTAKDLMAYGISRKKVEVIHHGIDNELFNDSKYEGDLRKELGLSGFVYTFFGRPGISKGLEYLIKAVPKIVKIVPESKLLLIVSSDKQNKKRFLHIKSLIKELEIEEFVKIISSVKRSELPNYLKISNCVVIPSLAEGFGFCAAEACACGVPIVVSRVDSLPEVAYGKVCFSKINDSESIAEGVINIYKGECELIPVKNFSWRKAVNEYLKLYGEKTS